MKAIFIFEGKLDESHQGELSKAVDVLAKDFGLESYLDDVLEDSAVKKDDIKEPQSKISCEGCGSTNLNYLARVDLNTNTVIHDFDLDGLQCDNCGGIESWRTEKDNKNGEQCKHGNSWASNCSDCDDENIGMRDLIKKENK